jgi:hypothetical protein
MRVCDRHFVLNSSVYKHIPRLVLAGHEKPQDIVNGPAAISALRALWMEVGDTMDLQLGNSAQNIISYDYSLLLELILSA